MENCKYACNEHNKILDIRRGYIPCPIHGGIKAQVVEMEVENDNNYYIQVGIPKRYWNTIDTVITGDNLMKELPKNAVYDSNNIQSLAGILNKIAQGVLDAEVHEESCLITIDSRIDIDRYVYALQLECRKQNKLTTVPYTTVRSLYDKAYRKNLTSNGYPITESKTLSKYITGLRKAYDTENPFTFNDYVTADVVFLKMGYIITPQTMETLGELLTERNERNKPTYVIAHTCMQVEWQNWVDVGYTDLHHLLITQGTVNSLAVLKEYTCGKSENKKIQQSLYQNRQGNMQDFLKGLEQLNEVERG